MRALVATLLIATLSGPAVQAQAAEEVFSLDPVTITAPWPLIPPQYKDVPKPPYPEAARARETEGTVFLLLQVLPDGRVGEVKVKKSSGSRLLDEAAVKAASSWTFTPARRGPTPVEALVEAPVKFELR
ncbi:MAG: energy transducer TonB [Candidatus Methylomirabilia bacterium]